MRLDLAVGYQEIVKDQERVKASHCANFTKELCFSVEKKLVDC